MNPYIQTFLAILIVVILFIVAMVFFNKEQLNAIRQTGTIKKQIPIFSGMADFYSVKNVSFDTLNPNAPNFIKLDASINQVAGAAYSYNFWLYIDNTPDIATQSTVFPAATDATNTNQVNTDTGLPENPSNGDQKPYVLFLRGSNKVLTYNNICNNLPNTADLVTANQSSTKQDILVKSPLVKLDHNGDALIVEFNTLNSTEGIMNGAKNTCVLIDTDWYNINQYKVGLQGLRSTVFSKKWFMVTIVLEDTYPTDPLPIRNKIRSQIYINGTLELDKYVVGSLQNTGNSTSSPLRINQGNLYINPQLQDSASQSVTTNTVYGQNKFMMADLTYYNYALQPAEVISLFNSKFNNTYAQISSLTNDTTDTSYLTSILTTTDSTTLGVTPLQTVSR
jgi:hypothetical protein